MNVLVVNSTVARVIYLSTFLATVVVIAHDVTLTTYIALVLRMNSTITSTVATALVLLLPLLDYHCHYYCYFSYR